MRPLRHADREDRASAGRGTWFCPTCQPRAPASGGEQLVEPRRRGRGARARCSRRSAGRRSGSAAPSSRPSARGARCRNAGSSSRGSPRTASPLRVEERLRADAVAAPARRIHLNSGHLRLQRRTRRRSVPVPRLIGHGRPLLQDRGRRAPLDPLRRGRPRAPPLHARPRPHRRRREGRPQDEVALRRAASSRSRTSSSMLHQGSGRAPDGHRRPSSSARTSAARDDYYRLSVGLIGAEAMLRLFTEQERTSARSPR